MKKRRIYIDTSVFGGLFDSEFSRPSEILFQQIKKGKYQCVISAVILQELRFAPPKVREFSQTIFPLCEFGQVSAEAIQLKDEYLNKRILGTGSENDAFHVSLATVLECYAILSWNFKHIVNWNKIPFFNAVNLEQGYSPIQIFSPWEVIESEE